MSRSDLGDDTAPQPIVPAQLSLADRGKVLGGIASVTLIRALLALVACAALVITAVVLFRHGISNHIFPSYVTGTKETIVKRYSSPWIAGAGGVLVLAGLVLTSAATDLFGWQQMRRAAR